jgi:hypothetical protein
MVVLVLIVEFFVCIWKPTSDDDLNVLNRIIAVFSSFFLSLTSFGTKFVCSFLSETRKVGKVSLALQTDNNHVDKKANSLAFQFLFSTDFSNQLNISH